MLRVSTVEYQNDLFSGLDLFLLYVNHMSQAADRD